MKTILTTIFAIALMVFAFNTNPANAAGAWGLFGFNDEPQVDEFQTASWDDDEKAEQYGGEWFKVDENGNIEVAYGCKMNSDGSVHCPGDAWNSENDESKVAWDTEPGNDTYCWQTVGKNGPETKCVPALWKEQYDEKQIAEIQEVCDRDECWEVKVPRNAEDNDNVELTCYGKDAIYGCFNEEDGELEIAWQPSVKTRSRGNSDSVQERTRVNQPFGNEESGETDIAYGATCTIDQQTGQRVCCAPTSFGGFFCYYPNADENQGTQVAGMTLDEKVKQDEKDWNDYILKQMFASYTDYCNRTGNCMMNEDGLSENIEQREFASDRNGPTSTFSASDGDNASLVGDSGDTIDAEDAENDRVLESGDY